MPADEPAAAPDPTAQVMQAVELLQAEQIDSAEAILEAVLREAPLHPDALHFLGVVRHTQNRGEQAAALIRRALDVAPANEGAWNNLGNVLLAAGRFDDAAQAYARSTEVAGERPQAAGALNNLAILHRKQRRLAEAEAASRRALALRPDYADAWYTLSQTLIMQGRVHDGLLANSRGVALLPGDALARDQVIHALLLLGERDHAAQLYRDWLAEEPGNALVEHQLAACLGEAVPERASDACVQQMFDGFAASFDAKLEKLDYRAPDLVARALHAAAGEPAQTLAMADVGCGTGLCGPLVAPWAGRLVGCDLSVGMLRRARERRVYHVLHKAELCYYLETQPAAFDVVISADTLCYFGVLERALAAACGSLRPGGALVFTVEALGPDAGAPFVLQVNGRYAHERGYVESTLAGAGLQVADLRSDTLRLEAGLPVAGWVVTARRPAAHA